MKITVLCSDPEHPVNRHLNRWVGQKRDGHDIELLRKRCELSGGDILFLVSCSEIIKAEHRSLYRHTLVLHASDLPKGRGWSPHVWEVVRGAEHITLSLLEAEDKVDSGRIWLKRVIPISKTDLWYDVNEKLFEAEVDLINEAVDNSEQIEPCHQDADIVPTYYERRTPADSELDPQKSIAEQFDLIRMCDPERYPAWFEHLGQKYKISLEKVDHEEI
ncbi:UDP-glucuronic acid dehydrogenase [Marinobacter sediminum]|uniref:formyltransferase family protein n=1 Tax=Marinobacter sediminum TaxID=256323 RepID=UPI00202ED2B5|nr:formyltransferase family protein [Marinobacter sediminum]MCM0612630.1 UDP-glucuronic acid dehydrogenase [Marinobacter sediminum]